MLVVRLQTLQQTVDWFVIVESRQSHHGHTKDIHFEKAIPRLGEAIMHQVIHIVLAELPGEGSWDRENFHRRSIFTKGLTHPGKEAKGGDIIIMSDLDEIPKPDVLAALKSSADFPAVISLECPLCYYTFANEGPLWSAPKVITWADGLDAQALRWSPPDCIMPRSCWHCSYCFSSIQAVQNKLSTSAHTEYSEPPYTDPEYIINHTRSGLDLFDRDNVFSQAGGLDAPAYVKFSASLQYLVSRDTDDAGYSDYHAKKA